MGNSNFTICFLNLTFSVGLETVHKRQVSTIIANWTLNARYVHRPLIYFFFVAFNNVKNFVSLLRLKVDPNSLLSIVLKTLARCSFAFVRHSFSKEKVLYPFYAKKTEVNSTTDQPIPLTFRSIWFLGWKPYEDWVKRVSRSIDVFGLKCINIILRAKIFFNFQLFGSTQKLV